MTNALSKLKSGFTKKIVKFELSNKKRFYRTLVQYYALNAMQISDVMNNYLRKSYNWDDCQLIKMMGIKKSFFDKLEDTEDSSTKKIKKIKKHIRKLHADVNSRFKAGQTLVEQNIAKLGNVIGLTKAEEKILAYMLVIKHESGFSDLLEDYMKSVTKHDFAEFLSKILNADYFEMINALSNQSTLATSGIIKSSKNVLYGNYELDILEGLSAHIMDEDFKIEDLLLEYVRKVEDSQYSTTDFEHVADDLDLVLPFLEETIRTHQKGVNILIHGKPGTGKTELTRAIGKFLNVALYEVKSEDKDGDPICGMRRLEYLKFAQKLLKKGRYLILFDEMEEAFNNDSYSLFGGLVQSNGKTEKKGWKNQLLENISSPVLWVSNNIDSLDKAYIRRFQYKLEMSKMPVDIRRKMVSTIFEDLSVEKNWCERLVKNESLTPAILGNAKDVAMALKKGGDNRSIENILSQIIQNDAGYQNIKLNLDKSIGIEDQYQLDLVHTSFPLNQLIDGLRRNQAGRICLFGPPGTGKTAFVKHVGSQLNLPVLVKTASSVFDKYVGETEKSIAGVFREAERENAILFLDEADSFLRQRSDHSKSWEVTQVNELLMQMENFHGIFFCSTNQMNLFDNASLRRFDLKVEFLPLSGKQRVDFFRLIARQNGLEINESEWEDIEMRLYQMGALTAGDFKSISRKNHLFYEHWTVADILKALESEVSMRNLDSA